MTPLAIFLILAAWKLWQIFTTGTCDDSWSISSFGRKSPDPAKKHASDISRSPAAVVAEPGLPFGERHGNHEPAKRITLVGSTNVGKSSTANALIGACQFATGPIHNTTRDLKEVAFGNGYTLQDTPGLNDATDYRPLVCDAVLDSEIVVYVCVGQLLRPQIDDVRSIVEYQSSMADRASGVNELLNRNEPIRKRRTIVFLNKEDLRDSTISSADRKAMHDELINQLLGIVQPDRIVVGSASPHLAPEADIDSLRSVINRCLALNDFSKRD